MVVNFDSAHVAAVLGPSVGMVIVRTANGGGVGSGFVAAQGGGFSYMVTNNHVIADAQSVQVLMPDGRHFPAVVQGTDTYEDIAVLRISDTSLPLAQFGDSTKLVVGQPVVAIGSPEANQGSVTSGIISALHRSITAGDQLTGSTESLPDVLQVDVPINPGNSGGPLADAAGNVVGVTTAGSTSASGINFAIPSLIARRIAEDLIAGRKPGHPYLGICSEDESDALLAGRSFTGFGVLVASVFSGEPAQQAGIRGGDVIEKVGDVALNNGETLGGALQIHEPGDKVALTVLRSGSTQSITVTLGDRPANPPGAC